MDPTKGCVCMDIDELRETYYPSWATPYDIKLSISEGYKYYFDLEKTLRLKDCVAKDQKCEDGSYFEEHACKCVPIFGSD